MSAERIHINEAVRTYNKTRQTFYNWIKKGYLQAKKINNKVYVATKDVEQLLSDYIGEYLPDTNRTHNHLVHDDEHQQDDTMFYELITELELQKHQLIQKVDDQKIWLLHEINLTKQELRTDIQRAAEGVQQQWHISNTQSQKQLSSTEQKVQILTTRLTLANKRISFRLWYIVFVLANITLLTILA